ncbi:hypothetical protein HYU15_00740 [Candidatus Woesearchaeota archaeon]|nr:hypothetical protein [Candidatus Woesearchaeota archaeon]
MGIERAVIISALAGAAATAVISFSPLCKTMMQDSEYRALYQQALERYADTNGDGFISRMEQDSFDTRLFEGRGVIINPGRMPIYKDGTHVPVPVLIEWVRRYSP